MNTTPVRPSVLVVSDSQSETALVQSILEGEFPHVVNRAEAEGARELFLELQAPVLVLAYRDLHKAEQFYLGVYRQGPGNKFLVHPHRTILLCSREDVRTSYDLCRGGLFDDYVQFWPMTYDASRLAMSVYRSLQECIGAAPGQSAAAFAVQARQFAQLEGRLARSLESGAGYAAAAGQAVVKAESHIGAALSGLAAHILDTGSTALAREGDKESLARRLAEFSAGSVIPHLREVSSTIQPLTAWIDDVGKAMEPHRKSTGVLLEMAAQVRPCVLIVDDDEFQRQIAGQILDSAGYQVRYAGNGGEALSMLNKLRPEVILMDLLMPDMTGLEVIERIKAEASLAHVPVIMFTGQAEREVVLDSLRSGASDFIVKPVDRQTLLDKVARLLASPGDEQPG